MVTVAVAGGLGHLGRSIVEGIQRAGKHDVVVLARKGTSDPVATTVPVVEVQYDDVDALARIFEAADIHTVISTIGLYSEQAMASESQLARASIASRVTKRFVTSDWGYMMPEDSVLPQKVGREAVCDILRQSDLEWTRFLNGFFLDYYGMPHLESHLQPTTFVVDMRHKVAAIPGSGDDLMTWTHSHDVANFVAAALDLPLWSDTTYCYGGKMTWNEFVRTAEEVTGSKFLIMYDDVGKLDKNEITELPSHATEYAYIPKPFLQGMYAQFGKHITQGCFDLPAEEMLRRQFAHVRPKTVKDVLDVWKGK